MRNLAALRLFWSILAIVGSMGAEAQTTEPAATPDSVLAVGDIAVGAENDEQFADAVQRRAQSTASTAAFDQRLKTLTASHDRLRKALRAVQIDALPIRRLESLERHWRFLSRDLDRWHKEFSRRRSSRCPAMPNNWRHVDASGTRRWLHRRVARRRGRRARVRSSRSSMPPNARLRIPVRHC